MLSKVDFLSFYILARLFAIFFNDRISIIEN